MWKRSYFLVACSQSVGCRAVASSIIGGGGGGAHIHIFVFTDHKNNRFQKKLIVQNMNI